MNWNFPGDPLIVITCGMFSRSLSRSIVFDGNRVIKMPEQDRFTPPPPDLRFNLLDDSEASVNLMLTFWKLSLPSTYSRRADFNFSRGGETLPPLESLDAACLFFCLISAAAAVLPRKKRKRSEIKSLELK